MLDPRVTALAEVLVGHSLDLGPDDSVLLHAFDIEPEAVAAVVRAIQGKGAKVALRLESNRVQVPRRGVASAAVGRQRHHKRRQGLRQGLRAGTPVRIPNHADVPNVSLRGGCERLHTGRHGRPFPGISWVSPSGGGDGGIACPCAQPWVASQVCGEPCMPQL